MDIDEQIKAAEKAVSDAHKVLTEAQKHRDDLYVQRSKERYGIEPGLRVRSRDGEYLVDEVQPESWQRSKPWLRGRKIKKNGALGNRQVTIYSEWEIVVNP